MTNLKTTVAFILLTGAVWAASSLETLQAYASSPRVINVGGQIDREGWLGFSVYASNGSASPYHFVRRVRPGKLREALYVDGAYAGGSYEVAVWDQQVARGQCKVKDCAWCSKNGYHLSTLRVYAKGSLPANR